MVFCVKFDGQDLEITSTEKGGHLRAWLWMQRSRAHLARSYKVQDKVYTYL